VGGSNNLDNSEERVEQNDYRPADAMTTTEKDLTYFTFKQNRDLQKYPVQACLQNTRALINK
jgi:hypothetical protein